MLRSTTRPMPVPPFTTSAVSSKSPTYGELEESSDSMEQCPPLDVGDHTADNVPPKAATRGDKDRIRQAPANDVEEVEPLRRSRKRGDPDSDEVSSRPRRVPQPSNQSRMQEPRVRNGGSSLIHGRPQDDGVEGTSQSAAPEQTVLQERLNREYQSNNGALPLDTCQGLRQDAPAVVAHLLGIENSHVPWGPSPAGTAADRRSLSKSRSDASLLRMHGNRTEEARESPLQVKEVLGKSLSSMKEKGETGLESCQTGMQHEWVKETSPVHHPFSSVKKPTTLPAFGEWETVEARAVAAERGKELVHSYSQAFQDARKERQKLRDILQMLRVQGTVKELPGLGSSSTQDCDRPETTGALGGSSREPDVLASSKFEEGSLSSLHGLALSLSMQGSKGSSSALCQPSSSIREEVKPMADTCPSHVTTLCGEFTDTERSGASHGISQPHMGQGRDRVSNSASVSAGIGDRTPSVNSALYERTPSHVTTLLGDVPEEMEEDEQESTLCRGPSTGRNKAEEGANTGIETDPFEMFHQVLARFKEQSPPTSGAGFPSYASKGSALLMPAEGEGEEGERPERVQEDFSFTFRAGAESTGGSEGEMLRLFNPPSGIRTGITGRSMSFGVINDRGWPLPTSPSQVLACYAQIKAMQMDSSPGLGDMLGSTGTPDLCSARKRTKLHCWQGAEQAIDSPTCSDQAEMPATAKPGLCSEEQAQDQGGAGAGGEPLGAAGEVPSFGTPGRRIPRVTFKEKHEEVVTPPRQGPQDRAGLVARLERLQIEDLPGEVFLAHEQLGECAAQLCPRESRAPTSMGLSLKSILKQSPRTGEEGEGGAHSSQGKALPWSPTSEAQSIGKSAEVVSDAGVLQLPDPTSSGPRSARGLVLPRRHLRASTGTLPCTPEYDAQGEGDEGRESPVLSSGSAGWKSTEFLSGVPWTDPGHTHVRSVGAPASCSRTLFNVPDVDADVTGQGSIPPSKVASEANRDEWAAHAPHDFNSASGVQLLTSHSMKFPRGRGARGLTTFSAKFDRGSSVAPFRLFHHPSESPSVLEAGSEAEAEECTEVSGEREQPGSGESCQGPGLQQEGEDMGIRSQVHIVGPGNGHNDGASEPTHIPCEAKEVVPRWSVDRTGRKGSASSAKRHLSLKEELAAEGLLDDDNWAADGVPGTCDGDAMLVLSQSQKRRQGEDAGGPKDRSLEKREGGPAGFVPESPSFAQGICGPRLMGAALLSLRVDSGNFPRNRGEANERGKRGVSPIESSQTDWNGRSLGRALLWSMGSRHETKGPVDELSSMSLGRFGRSATSAAPQKQSRGCSRQVSSQKQDNVDECVAEMCSKIESQLGTRQGTRGAPQGRELDKCVARMPLTIMRHLSGDARVNGGSRHEDYKGEAEEEAGMEWEDMQRPTTSVGRRRHDSFISSSAVFHTGPAGTSHGNATAPSRASFSVHRPPPGLGLAAAQAEGGSRLSPLLGLKPKVFPMSSAQMQGRGGRGMRSLSWSTHNRPPSVGRGSDAGNGGCTRGGPHLAGGAEAEVNAVEVPGPESTSAGGLVGGGMVECGEGRGEDGKVNVVQVRAENQRGGRFLWGLRNLF